ncbi:MAG: alkane 1-monooxygenase [Pseudomonadota bacterium]
MLDELIVFASDDAPAGVEFPAARWLSIVLGLLHIPVLIFAVATISGVFGASLIEQAAALFAFGLYFGQVSYSNAHELIHSARRVPFWLGTLVYSSTLYGHHVTAHRHIHHRYVGSDKDPNTARMGESFYQFALRAWLSSAQLGLAVENQRQRARFSAIRPMRHMFLVYGLIAFGMAAGITWAFGIAGLIAFLLLSIYATAQILLADYVQHYGLQRRMIGADKLEPIGIEHSWNAPHPISAALMLNAPRHSDHHAHPAKPFEALDLPEEDEAPMLPYSLPAMSTLALFPPIWRRVMDDRAAEWSKPVYPQAMAAE